MKNTDNAVDGREILEKINNGSSDYDAKTISSLS